MYQSLYGFKAKTTAALTSSSAVLLLDKSIAGMLGSNHTYLMIKDETSSVEIVKAYMVGSELKIERGIEGSAGGFPAGSCVQWVMSESAVKDVFCLNIDCPNCGDCGACDE